MLLLPQALEQLQSFLDELLESEVAQGTAQCVGMGSHYGIVLVIVARSTVGLAWLLPPKASAAQLNPLLPCIPASLPLILLPSLSCTPYPRPPPCNPSRQRVISISLALSERPHPLPHLPCDAFATALHLYLSFSLPPNASHSLPRPFLSTLPYCLTISTSLSFCNTPPLPFLQHQAAVGAGQRGPERR